MHDAETLSCLAFAEGGAHNTEATLRIAAERAAALDIDTMVVATSTGRTAVSAAELFDGAIIAVTLSAGHWERYCPPDPELIVQAQAAGVRVLTATHALMGAIDTAVQGLGGVTAAEIMARTYYTISQGAKVAVECALMAADAGLLDMQREIVSIAGTGGGADTALVIAPAFTNTCFDLRIREILAKPR